MILRERDDVLSRTDVSALAVLAESADEQLASRARTVLSTCRIGESRRIQIARSPNLAFEKLNVDLAFDSQGRLDPVFERKLRSGAAPTTLIPELFERASSLDLPLSRVAASEVVIALNRTHQPPPLDFSKLLNVWIASDDEALRSQIAWTAQLRGFGPMVRELGSIVAADDARRIAALDLMIEAMRIAPSDEPPLFKMTRSRRVRSLPRKDDAMLEIPLSTALETPSSAEPPDLPREVYAVAEAPSHAIAAQELTLTVGLTQEAPEPGATPFIRPSSSVGEYEIVISLQATGFTARNDITVFTLPVTHAKPNPTVDIFLTPEVVEDRTERTIAIFYSIDGQVIGSVERRITVHLEENDETRFAAREALRRIFSAPISDIPPDLTVMIRDDGHGTLAWSFMTPHKTVIVPRNPVHIAFNTNAKTFADLVVNVANTREGKSGLYEFLVGIGADIRAIIPPLFWKIVADLGAAAQNETPSLLVISNEPYIPWELAVFPKTSALFHPELAPFLGVQMRVGRWLIGNRLPPPRNHSVQHSYVISGVYNRIGWNRLVKAEEEADEIRRTYGAMAIEARFDAILGLFDTEPAPDLLHFSMHGRSDDDSVEDGLVPIDSGYVKPQMITGAIEQARRAPSPFVFLNACQVARGDRILGDYGGIAAAFINGGATGVIAPLWSVKDDIAKEIAIQFYKATLEAGAEPAEAIRQARASFVKSSAPTSATYLAYQFFGHPSLQLRKQ